MSERARLAGTRVLLATPRVEDKGNSVVYQLLVPLREAGVDVGIVELDHSASDPELTDEFRTEIDSFSSNPQEIVIGGFSLGARIAMEIAPSVRPLALLAFSFPAHKRGQPQATHGLQALRLVQCPTLIVQGERDSHGSRTEMRGYAPLPEFVETFWLEDANHQWLPKQSSPHTQEQHLQSAASAVLLFLGKLLSHQ
ncbi:MAG: dienelactone hydrolase family protein [Kofleriaceae bacterium]|nr:dienelactone hydrolase family protein [Kofleriaceae bacterium]